MVDDTSRRRFPRLSTGSEYGVCCKFAGEILVRAELQNLSAGGCGLRVPRAETAGIEMGARFDALYLKHPHLPYVPLEGLVMWMLGKVPGNTTGDVLVGLEFTAITPIVQLLIQEHVQKCLSGQNP